MRGALVAIGVFVASFVGVWFLAAAAALALGIVAGVSQAEGAYAMGMVFIVGPIAGLVGAVVLTTVVMVRRGRRSA